jgi:hypothetical protein
MMENPAPLQLIRARRSSFAPGTAAARMGRDSGEAVYYSDLATRYGLEFRPEALADTDSACFVEMAEQLLSDLQPMPGPIDLVVIGNAAPDLDIGRFVGCALSEASGGAAMFGVTDAGAATSFTALRAASAYAASASHILVFLLDQRVLPYDAVLEPGQQVTSDSGIALVFGPAEPGQGLRIRQYADVEAEGTHDILTAVLGDVSDVETVILGSGLAHQFDVTGADKRIVVAPVGRPTCGQWWAYFDATGSDTAGFDTAGSGAHRIFLADYDATDRSLSVAVVDVAAA